MFDLIESPTFLDHKSTYICGHKRQKNVFINFFGISLTCLGLLNCKIFLAIYLILIKLAFILRMSLSACFYIFLYIQYSYFSGGNLDILTVKFRKIISPTYLFYHFPPIFGKGKSLSCGFSC